MTRRRALDPTEFRLRRFLDPVLRETCDPVEGFGAPLRARVFAMAGILDAARGLGLSAPQVGWTRRLFIVPRRFLIGWTGNRIPQTAGHGVFVNPVVEPVGDLTRIEEEGCLSLPGVRVHMERYYRVRVSGVDWEGEPFGVEAWGGLARVLQHEADHLDGVLITNRAVDPDHS